MKPKAEWLVVALLMLGALACRDRGDDEPGARSRPDTSRAASPGMPPAEDSAATGACEVREFAPEPGTRVIRVFFTCGDAVLPVSRRVPETQAVLRASLDELLRGPTDAERRVGFQSFFNAGTAGHVESVVVQDDGVARISFDDFSEIIPNASSSAGSAELLSELHATIFQYPEVREAQLSFDGDCEAFWNWLQRGCEPLRRAQ